MTEGSPSTVDEGVPKVVVNGWTEVGALLLGVLAGVVAAYHAGRTGDPYPLLAVCSVLTLVHTFVTSDR
ncbi:hypothetical protein [Halostella litorea]|uniref:hypothetical protein n=1 Tax=Halostella litorea TaxID=2528831 RepID=UPI001093226E|nr:hypothetical protein [Halostella litorea]